MVIICLASLLLLWVEKIDQMSSTTNQSHVFPNVHYLPTSCFHLICGCSFFFPWLFLSSRRVSVNQRRQWEELLVIKGNLAAPRPIPLPALQTTFLTPPSLFALPNLSRSPQLPSKKQKDKPKKATGCT